MPRNVKESDDECESKGGRRTRTMLNPSVLDSPLRRSSRIRQPTSQNDLSPESNSDVSITGGSRSTRRRTTALDAINTEPQRNLRTRRNSATSDISELAENDSTVESIGKRITRRSIATVSSVESSSKLPPKTRRATRAGSETKSTPPVGRVTRRTRASSMEPEVTDDTRIQKDDTPLKSRKRASAMPSEPAVAEESEDSRIDRTVFDIDEDDSVTSLNVSKSSRRKSKGDATEDEKMEVDETHVVESEVDETDKSYNEKTEESCKVSGSSATKTLEYEEEMMDVSKIIDNNEKSPKRQRISSLSKGSSYTIENLLNDESPGNKENKISNTSFTSSTKSPQIGEVRLPPRKSLNSSLSKVVERRCSVTLDTELVSVYQETKKIAKAQEIVANNSISTSKVFTSKDYSLETNCVVVIKPIDAEQIATLNSDSLKIVEKQQFPSVEEKNESENDDNITEEIHVTKIIDVIDLEKETSEEQKEISVKDADDLQINEITDSSQAVNTPRVFENFTENKEPREESLTTEPIEELISESLTDEEASMKLIELEENDDVIFCDETTSDSMVTLVRDQSLEEKAPKDSQETAAISCEAITTTIMLEICDEEKISSTPHEEAPSKPEEKTPLKPEEETPLKPEEETSSKAEKETSSKPDEEIASETEKEIESCKIANLSAKSITNRVSPEIEMPKEYDDKDETEKIIDKSLKDRNPSIVTESPVRGTNAEESLKEPESPQKRRSVGKSGNEPAATKKNVEANEEGDGMRVFESDNESESIVCPSFKDIPADEWTDRENKEENAKSNNDGDSIHSYSTERNESECDIALVEKEPWQPSRKNKEENVDKNTNDDSDDTIIAKFDKESNVFVEIGGKRVDGKRLSDDELNEETPMDVLSEDIDENEQTELNVSKKSPKIRSSLNSSMKHRNDNETISGNRASESPLNVSSRKSLENDNANDSVDPEANLSNKSLNKSLKKRSSNASQRKENSSDDECNSEMNESRKSPKSEQSSRKSLLGSAKKSNTSVHNMSKSENRKSLNKPDFDSGEIEDSAIEEIEKKSRRSGDKRNSLNNSKVERVNLEFENDEENESPEKLNKSSKSESNRKSMNSRRTSKNDEEIADLSENLNQSSKSENNRKSTNSRRNSKNAEETADLSENLNKSSKSNSIHESLENKEDSDAELESSGSEIDKFENLLQQLNESTTSKSSRKSLNKNTSKIQEQSSDSETEENNHSQVKLNRSTKSMSDRKSLNNKNASKIQEQSSESEIEEETAKLNRSTKSMSDRKSLNNKNASKIQEQSSESEIEEETAKLNRSTKSMSDRKSLNNKNASKIQEQSSESEIEEETAKLNRSTKSMSDRKSLNNKNASKIQEQSSDSEKEEETAKLNRSTKSMSDRKSLNNKNASKIQEQSSDSEKEEETAKLNRSTKSMSDRKSLNNKNASKIQEQSSVSEIEEETAKLNRSTKSLSDRKSLNNKNALKIQEQSSDSEMEEETDSPVKMNRSLKSTSDRKSLNSRKSLKKQEQSFELEIEEQTAKLNRSSKSTSDRKSLNTKNTSKIREQSSDSEMEDEEEEEVKLNQSSKSTSDRKSLSNNNTSRIQEHSSGSEQEDENESQTKLNRSSKSSIVEMEKENGFQVDQSAKSKRKSLINSNGSITEPVESENDSDSGSSEKEDNSSQKFPLFLCEANTGSEEEDSENSIDPDIADEMNLHGKSLLVYSDDDVAGDDCMVTESESNDSEDDDGEDLKDFVVHDEEYDSEDGDSELDDDEHESSNKARKSKNKKRKRIIPKPNSDTDTSDSENEEETTKSSKISFNKDDSLKQIKSPTNKKINESSKAKNIKSPSSSSTLVSDEDSENLRVKPNGEEKSKTPKSSNKANESIQLIEEVINLNESIQAPTKKMQKLLSHSSTPRLSPNEKKTLEKLNSSKSGKLDNSKIEISTKSPQSESNTVIDTPAKLSMSFKETKTPKTSKSQLHTSLPTELNVSGDKTILSKVKSPKLSALHQTMTTIVSDTSEERFLMKEKLNESLPALKLAQRAKELRKSVLNKLREERNQNKDENNEGNAATTADQSIIEELVEPEVAKVEKMKKNKKKKKGANKEVVEDLVTLNESQEPVDTDVTSKKSKKRKKNKKQVEAMEIEETEAIEMGEISKKKKQKKSQVESGEEIVHEVVVEKKKKKKKQKTNVEEDIEESEKKKKKKIKHVTLVEPEVTIENSMKALKESKTESTISIENIEMIRSATGGSSKELSTRIKRLPEDVLESLSQSSERPKKRRKIAKEDQILPSKRMFSPGGQTPKNIKVEDDYISLSSFGGTTQFESVDLSKLMTKSNKKSTAVQSFRERMLSRNPRQPISAYLMYQQKQKAAGRDKLH